MLVVINFAAGKQGEGDNFHSGSLQHFCNNVTVMSLYDHNDNNINNNNQCLPKYGTRAQRYAV